LRTADTTASQSILPVGSRPIDDFERDLGILLPE
jgi:hypothetical protein